MTPALTEAITRQIESIVRMHGFEVAGPGGTEIGETVERMIRETAERLAVEDARLRRQTPGITHEQEEYRL